MAVRHGHIDRVELGVLNVVGSTPLVEVQLAFAEQVDRIERVGAALRTMIDLSAARLEGTAAQLNFLVAALERYTHPDVAEANTVCIVVMDRCPLRRELMPLSDLFASKLALLDRRHAAFLVTRRRGDAIDALEAHNAVL